MGVPDASGHLLFMGHFYFMCIKIPSLGAHLRWLIQLGRPLGGEDMTWIEKYTHVHTDTCRRVHTHAHTCAHRVRDVSCPETLSQPTGHCWQ